jgi:hypothetical protein
MVRIADSRFDAWYRRARREGRSLASSMRRVLDMASRIVRPTIC